MGGQYGKTVLGGFLLLFGIVTFVGGLQLSGLYRLIGIPGLFLAIVYVWLEFESTMRKNRNGSTLLTKLRLSHPCHIEL